LVPIALVSWRDQRRETMAIAWLSSGPHHGLPIVMVVTPDGNVRLRVRGEPEPFAAFTARKGPNNEPPTVPLDTPIAGILFGDLRSRGWAAAATGGILILPQEPLATDSDTLSDAPRSDS